MPQRKLSLDPIMPMERQLAEKLFGKSKVSKKLTDLMVAFPLTIFCNNKKHQNFSGDKIDAYSVKFCNEFFLTPTDVGICTTKNLAIKNILNYNLDNNYVWSTADGLNHTETISMDSYWARNTFILSTNAFDSENYLDTMTVRTNHENNHIAMQIHPQNELAQIMHKNKQDQRTASIELLPGHEYTIEVSPQGQESSDGYGNLSLEQRHCRLEHELPKKYNFRKYTKSNCFYDCYILMAFSKCQCIPWDFVHDKKDYHECDIFGRTCFFNEFDNLTHFPGNLCPRCLDECNFMEFHRRIVKDEKLINENGDWYCSKYICYQYDGKIIGKRPFLEYFLNQNNEMKDLDPKIKHKRTKISNINKNMIIVHLKYQSSKVDMTVIDTRYTLSDKIAKFGGTFGIWAELTGFSLLGIINVIIIIFKMLYKSIKKKDSSK